MENSYESLNTLPLQPTIMQSYLQNDYINSLSPISQPTQIPIDSSYIYSTNLPISFPNTTPYYSNSLNNCPPDQNSHSFTPYFANANPSAFSTSSTSMQNSPSSNNREQENIHYYYV